MHFHLGQREAADRLVKKYHYSHRVPSNIQLVGTWHVDGGLFGDTGEAVAAIYFTVPPTRWSEPVWELARLVRAEEVSMPPLTGLVSEAIHWVRKRGEIDLLVSFADWSYQHHGGVYQAASWNYAGCRDRRMDGLVYGKEFISGRTANHIWGTQSPVRLAERGIVVEPHYDEGKYLYWKALRRSGEYKSRRLGLESLPYPKPAEGNRLSI